MRAESDAQRRDHTSPAVDFTGLAIVWTLAWGLRKAVDGGKDTMGQPWTRPLLPALSALLHDSVQVSSHDRSSHDRSSHDRSSQARQAAAAAQRAHSATMAQQAADADAAAAKRRAAAEEEERAAAEARKSQAAKALKAAAAERKPVGSLQL